MNICADNLNVTLGNFRLRDVSLTINNGEIFSIIGETGSGKSVLLESLAGFYVPDGGIVTYDGKNVRDIRLEERRIGFVYQDYALFPHMSVRKNIEFGMKMHGMDKKLMRQKADEMMRKFRISHIADRKPGALSGGEQQRTALARALVTEPRVLFMDEPFSALDPNTRQHMYSLIREVHEELGCSIVFVTHDFHEAEELADNVGIMIKGELKACFRADELRRSHGDLAVDAFLGLGGI